MQIQHMLWQKAPYTGREMVEIGSAFWEINNRSHGDYEDYLVIIYGYFSYKSDGKIVFVPIGLKPETFEVESHRVERYAILID